MPPQLSEHENLLKTDSIKLADRDEASILQHLKNAEGYADDASTAKNMQSRFLMAYEGIHTVALAVLLHFGARPGDGDGHRIKALQIAATELKLDKLKPGSIRLIGEIHRIRNDKIYHQPLPPVSEATANGTLQFLNLILKQAHQLIADAKE